MSERQGIEIDYCPKCRGVWLDRGELDKIIERASPDQAPRRGDEPPRDDRGHGRDHGRDDDHQYGRKPYRKKKSLLDDLFDF
jgi:Zn-finger nucleic acid-binding protein